MTHDPLWAYGNNYDQVRYTSCFYVFPHRPGVEPGLYSPAGPQEFFSRQTQIDGPCVLTTELAFVGLAAAWLAFNETADGRIPQSIRPLGLLQLLLFLGASGWLMQRLWRDARHVATLGVAAATALVWMDPANLLWANSFYAEYVSLTALTICVGVLLVAWLERPSRVFAVAMALAAFALALGKVQFAPLPLALWLAAVLAARLAHGPLPARFTGFLIGALLGLGVQFFNISRTDDPMIPVWHRVSIFNVAFNGVLGSSDDPARTARHLGLPEVCGRYAGKTIFDFPGQPEWEAACPEVFGLSRAGIVAALAVQEPGTLMRTVSRAFLGVHPWVQRELGHVAGVAYGYVTDEVFSFGPWLERWRGLAMLLMLAPMLFLLAALAWPRLRAPPFELAWLGAWLACAVIWQQLLLTAFGDGIHDLSRQAFLVLGAAMSWAIASLVGLVALISRRPA